MTRLILKSGKSFDVRETSPEIVNEMILHTKHIELTVIRSQKATPKATKTRFMIDGIDYWYEK